MWNALIAGIVFQHETDASLLRELARNAQLLLLCGFHDMNVPTASAFSRFLTNLMEHEDEVNAIFKSLVTTVTELVPDFGQNLALDGKAIETYANPLPKGADSSLDGRRDVDANWGRKDYKGIDKNGNPWLKVVTWYGYTFNS